MAEYSVRLPVCSPNWPCCFGTLCHAVRWSLISALNSVLRVFPVKVIDNFIVIEKGILRIQPIEYHSYSLIPREVQLLDKQRKSRKPSL